GGVEGCQLAIGAAGLPERIHGVMTDPLTRHSRESGNPPSVVIPAKAGTHRLSSFPRKRESICCRPASCCHRIPRSITWIPAFAGMTNWVFDQLFIVIASRDP